MLEGLRARLHEWQVRRLQADLPPYRRRQLGLDPPLEFAPEEPEGELKVHDEQQAWPIKTMQEVEAARAARIAELTRELGELSPAERAAVITKAEPRRVGPRAIRARAQADLATHYGTDSEART